MVQNRRPAPPVFQPLLARPVDFYHRDGRCQRSVFVIENKVDPQSGRVGFTQLRETNTPGLLLADFSPDPSGTVIPGLKRKLRLVLTDRRNEQPGLLVDGGWHWIEIGPGFDPSALKDESRYPFRFEWDGVGWRRKRS